MIITLLICAATLTKAECTAETARKVEIHKVEGVICGAPYQVGFDRATAPDASEFYVIKCRMEK
jgi:hypothetical protein